MALGRNFGALSVVTRTSFQLMVVAPLFSFAACYAYATGTLFNLASTMVLLGLIGAVTALTTTVSFGFIVFFLSQTNARKHDLFYKFKTTLFDLEKFLRDYPIDIEAVFVATTTSIELSKLTIRDFPICGDDWQELVEPACNAIDDYNRNPADVFLAHRIYWFFDHAEVVMNDLNLMCIRQAIGHIYVGVVTKALLLLALLVVLLTAHFLADSRLAPALYASPVFFGASVIVLLLEVSFWVNRDHRNTLSDFMNFGDDDVQTGHTSSTADLSEEKP